MCYGLQIAPAASVLSDGLFSHREAIRHARSSYRARRLHSQPGLNNEGISLPLLRAVLSSRWEKQKPKSGFYLSGSLFFILFKLL